MTNDELVRALAADLRPVRRLARPESRGWRWAALALGCVAAGAMALGTRPDLGERLREGWFLLENGALLLVFLGAARSAFQLSVPGAARGRVARLVPALGLASWALLLAVRHLASGEAGPDWGLGCVWRVIGLAAIPALAAWLMLRRAAPLRTGCTGWYTLLAAGAVAIVGTRALCANDAPLHMLVWHLLPVLLIAALGLVGGGLWRGRPVRRD